MLNRPLKTFGPSVVGHFITSSLIISFSPFSLFCFSVILINWLLDHLDWSFNFLIFSILSLCLLAFLYGRFLQLYTPNILFLYHDFRLYNTSFCCCCCSLNVPLLAPSSYFMDAVFSFLFRDINGVLFFKVFFSLQFQFPHHTPFSVCRFHFVLFGFSLSG